MTMPHVMPAALSAAAVDLLIANSIGFDGSTSYLSRTPSVAGNTLLWRYETWFKRSNPGVAQEFLLSAYQDASNYTNISIFTDRIDCLNWVGGVAVTRQTTTAKLRDSNGWYHLAVTFDGTDFRIWINGVEATAFDTDTSAGSPTAGFVNATVAHEIGRFGAGSNYFNGRMAYPTLVDGVGGTTLLTAEIDANNYINPIEFNATAVTDTAPTGSYVSSAQDASSLTTYTFSSQSIGTANTDRQVFVSISGKQASGSGLNISSCTIGGVTANVITEQQSSDATVVGWAYANVPTGTTGDIVVTFDAGAQNAAIDVFTTTIANPVVWADNGAANNATSLTASINTPTSDGFILAAAAHTDSSNTATVAWTGDVTESADNKYDTSVGHSSALGTASSGSGSVTVTWDGGSVVAANNALSVIHVSGRDGYGPNGSQLDFADSSFLGKDVKATRTDLTATFEASYVDGTTTSAYTFSSCDLGAGTSNKRVIVGTSGAGTVGTETISSVTIDGITATSIIEQDSAGGGRPTGLFYADTNSTTGDVVVTFSTNCSEAGIGIWSTTTEATPFDTESNTANNTAVTVDCPEDGFTIGYRMSATGGATFTWTGLTEDFDEVQRASFASHTGAHTNYSSYTSQSVSVNSSTGTQHALVVASFVPANDFESSGLVAADQLSDSPTDDATTGIGNFCQYDPDFDNGGTAYTVSEYGTKAVSGAADAGTIGNIGVGSGKWYFEFTALQAGTNFATCGVVSESVVNSGDLTDSSTTGGFDGYGGSKVAYGYVSGDGNLMTASTDTSYGNTYTTNDIVGVALDLDNGAIWFSKNGTWQASATVGEIEAGTTTNAAATGLSGTFFPLIHTFATSEGFTLNTGQSAFNTAAPTGFSELATQNLPSGHPLYVAGRPQLRAGVQIVTNAALGANTSGAETNTCQRQEIDASIMADQDAQWIRVKFAAYTSEGWKMDQAYVGEKAGSGNAWDFDGNQVQLTFNGSAGVTVPAGAEQWSDWVALSTTGSINKIVSCNVGSDTANDAMARETGATGYTRHAKNSSDEAGDTAPTGFTSNGTNLGFVKAIEVQ